MNKTEIINEIAARSKNKPHPVNIRQADNVIKLMCEILEEKLKLEPTGYVVSIRGYKFMKHTSPVVYSNRFGKGLSTVGGNHYIKVTAGRVVNNRFRKLKVNV